MTQLTLARQLSAAARIEFKMKRQAVRAKTLLAGGLLAVLLALSLLLNSWTSLQALRRGYEISQATAERAELLELNRRLTLELARLEALDRIEKIARGELGMSEPSLEQVVSLK